MKNSELVEAEGENEAEEEAEEEAEKKSRNKPKQHGEPNSVEAQHDKDGELKKYTEFDENGDLKKEVRLKGKGHDDIPRPNVKEPVYNTNPQTGQRFHNVYRVRPAEPWELVLPK